MKALTLATLMTLAATPVFAFNLSDAANAVSALQNQKQQGQVQAPEVQANLLNTLGSQLNITPEQAVGGAGAMLGLARNNLSSDDYGQLTKAVPGLDLLAGANALGGLSGLGDLLGKNSENQCNRSMNPTYHKVEAKVTVASLANSSMAAALRSLLSMRRAAVAPGRGAATYRALGR